MYSNHRVCYVIPEYITVQYRQWTVGCCSSGRVIASYLPRGVERHYKWTFMSVPTTSVPSPPRSARPIAARKQQPDAVWSSINPTSVTSAKRQAVERIEGEPRNKRKRVESTTQTTSQLGHRVDKLQERLNDESPVVSFVCALVLPSGRYSAQS